MLRIVSLVYFLEKLRRQQIAFEIYWPLAVGNPENNFLMLSEMIYVLSLRWFLSFLASPGDRLVFKELVEIGVGDLKMHPVRTYRLYHFLRSKTLKNAKVTERFKKKLIWNFLEFFANSNSVHLSEDGTVVKKYYLRFSQLYQYCIVRVWIMIWLTHQ